MSDNLIEIQKIKKDFIIKSGVFGKNKGKVHAVDDVSLSIKYGETYGLVGESGCGKSTLSRTMLKLTEPTEGRIFFENKEITQLNDRDIRPYRKEMSMIFQKPYSALNPRQTLREIISAPMIVQKTLKKDQIDNRVLELMELVGLSKKYLERHPHEFSGGQRQRIMIARAIALKPKLIVCDEPVSALDVSIQSQILNLLIDLQNEFKLTYLFVSHDLSVVNFISDRVGVMYLGSIVEEAYSNELYKKPLHPYTKALFSAIPEPKVNIKKDRIILKGDIPNSQSLPRGCKFYSRCNNAMDVCANEKPEIIEAYDNHFVACHLYRKGSSHG